MGLVDLTNLDDDSTAADIEALCARANGPHGSVAAVCVWPRFVTVAKHELRGTPVRVATVVNFPSGAEPLADVVAQSRAALAEGADEIDVVLPYRALAAGDEVTPVELLDAVRSVVPRDGTHLLKVILETGELGDLGLVDRAARLAIDRGADFIKTSTGKTPRSASLEATAVMLAVIHELDPAVGLKPSGGIRTLDDAAGYLAQADGVMGADWVSWRTFRFGASGLLSALLTELDRPGSDTAAVPVAETDY
jgi:deoxyribose-phosphate aldolase